MQTALEYLQILGLPVKDRVTGFEGVVSSVSFDLYGCVQCIVTPKTATADQAPKLNDSHWFDFKRLEVKKGAKAVMELPDFTKPEAVLALESPKEGRKHSAAEPGPAAKPSTSTRA